MDETITTEEEIITPEEETLEIDLSEGEEDVEALKKQIATLKAQKEHFRKKSEKVGDVKKLNTSSDNVFTREEAVLVAQGMSLDDLDKLKGIQKGLGLKNLKEAQESDLFVAYSEKKKADKRRESASLGASGGTGKSSEVKAQPNMSEEEHRKLWAEHYKK